MVHNHREDEIERISFKGYPVWKALVLHILSLKKVKNRILNDIETEQAKLYISGQIRIQR